VFFAIMHSSIKMFALLWCEFIRKVFYGFDLSLDSKEMLAIFPNVIGAQSSIIYSHKGKYGFMSYIIQLKVRLFINVRFV